jgi:hypothetical protein
MIDIRCLVIDLFSPAASRPEAVKVRRHSNASCRRYPPLDEKLDRPRRRL